VGVCDVSNVVDLQTKQSPPQHRGLRRNTMTTQTTTQNQTSINVTATEVLHENCLIVKPIASYMTADRTIDLKKLGIDVKELPAAVRKKMSTAIFDDGVFKGLKKEVYRVDAFLNQHSFKSDMGYMMNPAAGKAYVDLCKEVTEEFNNQKAAIQADWDKLCQSALDQLTADSKFMANAKSQEILDAIKKKQPTAEQFDRKVNFSFYIQSVGFSGNFDAELYAQYEAGLQNMKAGVVGEAIVEVVRKCSDIYDSYNQVGKDHINSKAVKSLWALVNDKLSELAFISPKIRTLHKQLTEVFGTFSRASALRGQDMKNFLGVCDALRNQIRIVHALDAGEPILKVEELSLGSNAVATKEQQSSLLEVATASNDTNSAPAEEVAAEPAEEDTSDNAVSAEELVEIILAETEGESVEAVDPEVVVSEEPLVLGDNMVAVDLDENSKAIVKEEEAVEEEVSVVVDPGVSSETLSLWGIA